MTYTELDGSKGEANVGTAFCGVGFIDVTLTTKDILHEGFDEWFNNSVKVRMLPIQMTEKKQGEVVK